MGGREWSQLSKCSNIVFIKHVYNRQCLPLLVFLPFCVVSLSKFYMHVCHLHLGPRLFSNLFKFKDLLSLKGSLMRKGQRSVAKSYLCSTINTNFIPENVSVSQPIPMGQTGTETTQDCEILILRFKTVRCNINTLRFGVSRQLRNEWDNH